MIVKEAITITSYSDTKLVIVLCFNIINWAKNNNSDLDATNFHCFRYMGL